jgi:prepilin-type N-terminal cleavage/methylation domain-containing protein
MSSRLPRAFTLVEILIVVVILGILAAIAFAGFTGATDDARQNCSYSELQKIRRHVGVYQARNSMRLPTVTVGNGTWGEIIGPNYLYSAPVNAWVGGDNSKVIVFGSAPDTAYQTDHGWIFDPVTGQIYAGSFDAQDHPIPRP